MKTLSICVIAKNEEKFLEKSLVSIAPVADEIVFVDTGSTDNTVNIASQFTNKISHFKWMDDFAEAYNFVCDRATKDYVFRWDSDFFVSTDSVKRIHKLKHSNFHNSNLLAFSWQNIDTKYEKPTGQVIRDLIYRTGDFHNCSPIHAHFCPLPGTIVKRHFDPKIVIEHHKHHSDKKYRYTQSYEIIKKTLLHEPNDAYLTFHLIIALIYNHEYNDALIKINKFLVTWPNYIPERTLVLLEKKIACLIQLDRKHEMQSVIDKYSKQFMNHPQFILLEADCLAITDPQKAIHKYKEFLSKNYKPTDTTGAYNFERLTVHPHDMLAKLESAVY